MEGECLYGVFANFFAQKILLVGGQFFQPQQQAAPGGRIVSAVAGVFVLRRKASEFVEVGVSLACLSPCSHEAAQVQFFHGQGQQFGRRHFPDIPAHVVQGAHEGAFVGPYRPMGGFLLLRSGL